MNVNDFIKLREKDWQRLQSLIDKYKGRSGLSAAEVRELGLLYRAVTSDLALARRDYRGQRVTVFLNQLLTRTHSFIYQEDVSDLRRIRHYFTHTVPQRFRQSWPFTLAAFLLFMIPALVSYRLASTNPAVAEPLGLSDAREVLEAQELWTDIPLEARPYAAAFIMGNNIRVAILAFAGGVSFGLFTVYILVMNGLSIGGVLGLSAHYGLGQPLLEFVFGHGVVELSVIFFAGGAGLQLGWALLSPGFYSRRDALRLAAVRAGHLAVAVVPFLMVAGLIEGFLSPSDAPFGLRMAVGLGSGAVMYAYLLLAGRSPEKNGIKSPGMPPSNLERGDIQKP